MKKNTSCGCGGQDHKHCPPLAACDTAKVHHQFCEADEKDREYLNAVEETRILDEVKVKVLVEADICLPQPARDIKSIRKNVHLTQCKAVPVNPDEYGRTKHVNLFIEGFVHKNIQFSEGCNGYVRDHSVNVPFKCYQPIKLDKPVLLKTSQKSNQINEIRELDKDGMGSNRCSFGSVTFEFFNEPVECKILWAEIHEMDFPKNFDRWDNFRELTEKMSIDFKVRLTQVQVDDEYCPPSPKY